MPTVLLYVELWVTVKQGVVVIAWLLWGCSDRSAFYGVVGNCLANRKFASTIYQCHCPVLPSLHHMSALPALSEL